MLTCCWCVNQGQVKASHPFVLRLKDRVVGLERDDLAFEGVSFHLNLKRSDPCFKGFCLNKSIFDQVVTGQDLDTAEEIAPCRVECGDLSVQAVDALFVSFMLLTG